MYSWKLFLNLNIPPWDAPNTTINKRIMNNAMLTSSAENQTHSRSTNSCYLSWLINILFVCDFKGRPKGMIHPLISLVLWFNFFRYHCESASDPIRYQRKGRSEHGIIGKANISLSEVGCFSRRGMLGISPIDCCFDSLHQRLFCLVFTCIIALESYKFM